jgi:hypothetical protein
MQLMRLADVPLDQRDRVFYYSRVRAIAGATILVAIIIAASAFGWLKNMWLAYYVAAVVAICLLIFQGLVTARFLPSNWLIRMTDHGLFLKFRSYLNHRFPDQDPAVVFLPYSEIRSAQLIKERQVLSDRHYRSKSATATKTRRLIGLDLAGDTAALMEALSNERKRVFNNPIDGGGAKTRYHHLPIRLDSATFLTIEWGVVPSAQTILDALTRHTLVRHPTAVSKDFVDLDKLSTEQQETRLLELAESGDVIGAVAIARQLYSYDLTTAKAFVDGLLQNQGKPPTIG